MILTCAKQYSSVWGYCLPLWYNSPPQQDLAATAWPAASVQHGGAAMPLKVMGRPALMINVQAHFVTESGKWYKLMRVSVCHYSKKSTVLYLDKTIDYTLSRGAQC